MRATARPIPPMPRIVGVAIAGVGVCVALAGCRSAPGQDDAVTRSYDGVHRIVVDSGPGDVTLLRSRTAAVDVTVSRHWTGVAPDATPVLHGDVLTIRSRCTEQSSDALLGDCSVDARVSVPVGAVVVVRSMAGSVTANGLDVSSFDATTHAGIVSASFVSAPESIRARSEAGDVELTVPSMPYRIDVGTDVGATQVDVQDDPAAGHSIFAHTDVGDVRVLRG